VVHLEDVPGLAGDPVGPAVLDLIEAIREGGNVLLNMLPVVVRNVLRSQCGADAGNPAIAHAEIPRYRAERYARVLG
jgi:hypothetical protein